MRYKLFAKDQFPYVDGVSIFLLDCLGKPQIAEITMKTPEEGEVVPPLVILFREDARALMDSLWSAGVRPTDAVDSPGELKATKHHLSDMRRLTDALFNKIIGPASEK